MASEDINFEVFDRFPNYDLEGLPSTTSRQTESENLAFSTDCTFMANIDPRLQTTCSEAEESCTKAILHALQGLCVPPSACLSVSDDNLSTPSVGCSHRPTRKMDDVLRTNRSVIDLVERVSRCSCSTIPSVQLLVVTVCDRLIAWHQAALRHDSQQHLQERNPYATSQDEHSEHVLPQRITMGEFSVDPAMQFQICEQLVMAEVRRVEEITRLFAARIQQVKNQNTSTQSQKIYETLASLLRQQLQAQARVGNGRMVSG